MRLLAALFAFLSFQVYAENFQAGKEFLEINVPADTAQMTTPGKVTVTEFFSYGCPACYQFEPTMEAWLKTKPKNVVFKRVPVEFHAEWTILAKAYYTADALGVAEQMAPIMFEAIHKKHMTIDDKSLPALFEKANIKPADFANAFNFSPSMDAYLALGRKLLIDYKIVSVPTIIIDGKYQLDIMMVKGDAKKFIAVLDFLVKKETSTKK